jgi:hypothetical protein
LQVFINSVWNIFWATHYSSEYMKIILISFTLGEKYKFYTYTVKYFSMKFLRNHFIYSTVLLLTWGQTNEQSVMANWIIHSNSLYKKNCPCPDKKIPLWWHFIKSCSCILYSLILFRKIGLWYHVSVSIFVYIPHNKFLTNTWIYMKLVVNITLLETIPSLCYMMSFQ